MRSNLQSKKRHQSRLELHRVIALNSSDRLWHFPVLAGLVVGICLGLGYYFDQPKSGNIATMGALTILYFTHQSLEKRMVHMVFCAFAMTFCFLTGLIFSFSPDIGVASIGVIAFLAHLLSGYFSTPPPGNFFFIMVGCVAVSMPYDFNLVPERIGLFAMGSMLSVLLAFIYSVFISKKVVDLKREPFRKIRYERFYESLLIGVAIVVALSIGFVLDNNSPYWTAISTLAVVQGRNLLHTRERNIQRIMGTFLGVGLTWLILLTQPSPLYSILIIASLQFVIELLIVRNYLYAAIFITPLTILLAESSLGISVNVNTLMVSRLLDSLIGSLLGLLVGVLIHHDGLRKRAMVLFRFFYHKTRR